jgi:hypothetical protein
MAAPSIAIDGSQQYGTPLITTNTGGVAYKLNNIQINRPNKDARDYDATGNPQRGRYTADFAEMTAEAQLATSSTIRPQFGDTFNLNVDVAYGSELWMFLPTEYAASNDAGAIRVAPVRCVKLYNGAPTLVA